MSAAAGATDVAVVVSAAITPAQTDLLAQQIHPPNPVPVSS